MMKLKFVTLENGMNYMIMQEEKYNNTKYLYLVNENDKSDFCIRKIVSKNSNEYIVTLENQEEFNLALQLFKR